MSQTVMTRDDSDAPLRLEGELTIYQAAEIKPRLMGLIAQAETPCLDLSDVTDVDSAGLQLLLLALRAADAVDKPLRLIDPSAALLDVLALCNLTSLIEAAVAPAPQT